MTRLLDIQCFSVSLYYIHIPADYDMILVLCPKLKTYEKSVLQYIDSLKTKDKNKQFDEKIRKVDVCTYDPGGYNQYEKSHYS